MNKKGRPSPKENPSLIDVGQHTKIQKGFTGKYTDSRVYDELEEINE